jgi:small-conductance mechanosensitive channel
MAEIRGLDTVNYLKTLDDQINAMVKGFIQHVPSLTIALFVLILAWLLAKSAVRIADRLTRNTKMRDNLKQLVETIVRMTIWVVGLLVAATISMPGMTPASLFAGLGIGALAIGFAFQDIFENFLAGVLIMVRDRMRIGDTIECQSITGKVERITLRETHIRAPTNELTIVPNSVLFKNPVKITTDLPHRRFETIVSVVSDHDLDAAADCIKQALEAIEDLDHTHPVEVFAHEFKPGAVDFLVRWWSAARAQDFAIRDQVIRRIKQAFDETRIVIAGAQPTTIALQEPSAPEAAKPPAPPARPAAAPKQAQPV